MKWLLYIAVAFLPFTKATGTLTIGEAEISPFDGLVMFGFFVSLVAYPLVSKRFKLQAFDYVVLVWCLLNIFTLILNASNFFKELNQFRYYIAIPVALYFITRLYAGKPELIKGLCAVFVFATTAMAIAGFVEYARTSQRIITTAGGSHSGAILLIGGALAALYLMIVSKNKVYKFVLLCASGVILVALILTMARTLILAAVVIPVVLKYLLLKRQALVKLFFIGLFVLGTITPIIFIGISEVERLSRDADVDMSRLTDVTQLESGVAVRVKVYSISLEYIAERPFLGHGGGVYDKMYRDGFYLAHAHNVILEILLRNGVLGLCVFIILVYVLVKQSVAGYKNAPKGEREIFVLFLSLIAIVLANGFTNNIANLVSNSALWFYSAILVSAASYWRMHDHEEVNNERDNIKPLDKHIHRGVKLRSRSV